MTEKAMVSWIKVNLGPVSNQCLNEQPDVIYTEDWLGAMVGREVGELLYKYIPQGLSLQEISNRMISDYILRKGETKRIPHGYGFWQADIGSLPDFVKRGDWKDPYKACNMAIFELEQKRKWLMQPGKMDVDKMNVEDVHRAFTSAYNCGEGNVYKALQRGKDVDYYTFNKDYSKDVWRLRDIYRSL